VIKEISRHSPHLLLLTHFVRQQKKIIGKKAASKIKSERRPEITVRVYVREVRDAFRLGIVLVPLPLYVPSV